MTTDKRPLAQVLQALSFAASKHRNQRRKDSEASPYINHPISLAAILAAEAGVDDTAIICAAILHDTIEDTETTAQELEAKFGGRIAAIVMEVTDDKSLPKERRKELQVEKAAYKSHDAKLVKLADKIANLRDIASSPPASWSVERRQQYFDWADEVVAGMRGANPVLERLFDEARAARP